MTTTIGDVYNPIIEAARTDDPAGHQLLEAAGEMIFKANPDRCGSREDGIEAARRNLDYYCQYFSGEVAAKVKEFYGLGAGYRCLDGNKIA